ncbi:transcriptional regulator [uncultured Friedmanniella sp.]|uniref:transcriptional regulator n=1 Tax=uncultured Friedmanniella sp. TaxID=335381 RepID=UPI0035CA1C85
MAAFLSGCDEAVFATVLEGCGLTKSTLSKSVYALEEVGYLTVRKGRHERLPRTWLSLITEGRTSLARHLDALRQIADQAASRAVTAALCARPGPVAKAAGAGRPPRGRPAAARHR